MAGRDLIVIGASTGGVEALSAIVRSFPSAFPASIFIVCHIPPTVRSRLPEILSRVGPLLATHPADGDPFYPGHIYIAPPDHHLLLGDDGRMRLSHAARENLHRPAIDPLFRTAARHYGRRVVGVILTGGLNDGTAGLLAIRAGGGLAVIQEPADAAIGAMPRNAAQVAGADHIVPLADVSPLLVDLIREGDNMGTENARGDPIEEMPEVVDRDMAEQARNGRGGQVSVFTCPECGGALWQVEESRPLRFRCHVGHSYNGEILLAEQTEALEAALWTAVRTFREKSVLARQLAHRERAEGLAETADRFDEQAEVAERYGSLIRDHLLHGPPRGLAPVGSSSPSIIP